MKLKKLGALALTTAMMSVSVLAGCGSDDSGSGTGSGTTTTADNSKSDDEGQDSDASITPEAMTLKVWVPEGEIEITQQICDDFNNEHPEFDITYDITVTGIDEAANALTNDAEIAADVFQLPSGSLSQLVDA